MSLKLVAFLIVVLAAFGAYYFLAPQAQAPAPAQPSGPVQGSMPQETSGTQGSGDMSGACTAPPDPAAGTQCPGGESRVFYPSGDSHGGTCAGSWVCAQGL